MLVPTRFTPEEQADNDRVWEKRIKYNDFDAFMENMDDEILDYSIEEFQHITQQDKKDAILEKVSIMIDIMMDLLDKPYSDCYALIINSQTYKLLTMGDVGALHDSPQANLIDIGEELKNRGLIESNQLTEFAIKEHAKKMVSLS